MNLELLEDRVLAEPVDDQRPVAALADPLVLAARRDPDVLGEDALLRRDRAPAELEPCGLLAAVQ
jgi:hypothetical protein